MCVISPWFSYSLPSWAKPSNFCLRSRSWLEKITSFTPQNPVIWAPETWWNEILACIIPGSKVYFFPWSSYRNLRMTLWFISGLGCHIFLKHLFIKQLKCADQTLSVVIIIVEKLSPFPPLFCVQHVAKRNWST
jgi:hypothetical protein